MATRITHFLHQSTVTGAQSLGTAFSVADVHVHDLTEGQAPIVTNSRNWYGILEGIFVKLTSGGAPTATTVTMRLCADAAGDEILIPDTTATLVAGVTTTTTQAAAFSVKLPLFQLLNSPGNGSLYLFLHVDNAGTAPVMAQTTLTWSE
jgi:hypothetical protein